MSAIFGLFVGQKSKISIFKCRVYAEQHTDYIVIVPSVLGLQFVCDSGSAYRTSL